MAIALLIVGLLMIITGARGTYAQFGSQLASEFMGQNSFTYQALALGTVGIAGYVPALQTISRWVLAFILLVIFLSNKQGGGQSFFTALQAALKTGPTAPQAPQTQSGSAPSSSMASAVSAAATGNNPGSDMLGQFTFQNFTQPLQQWWNNFATTNYPSWLPGGPKGQ